MEESEENRIVKKETNFDNIVDTTFKLGLSEKEKKQKNNILLPHFEKIDREEDTDMIQFKDDEQDELDDVDV